MTHLREFRWHCRNFKYLSLFVDFPESLPAQEAKLSGRNFSRDGITMLAHSNVRVGLLAASVSVVWNVWGGTRICLCSSARPHNMGPFVLFRYLFYAILGLLCSQRPQNIQLSLRKISKENCRPRERERQSMFRVRVIGILEEYLERTLSALTLLRVEIFHQGLTNGNLLADFLMVY